MGVRDHATAFRSSWQNGYAEGVIGSILRECLDHVIVVNEAHLRRLLAEYADYNNERGLSLKMHRTADLLNGSAGSRLVQF
jgi:hypothetical protein